MFRPSHRTSHLRRGTILVLLAMLVVGLGLPRLLLVCNESCCGGRVALARSCGIQERANASIAQGTQAAENDECPCWRRARAAERSATRRFGTLSDADRDCGGCAHHALGCELGLPNAFEAPDVPPIALCHAVAFTIPWRTSHATTALHPPGTGPPRPDPRTARLATTILRI